MPIVMNIDNNPFLQELFEEGRRKGLQEGHQEGLQEGRRQSAQALLSRQVEWRFGPSPDSARLQLEVADLATLESWGLCLLEASTLNEVLRSP
jgi:predicted transposase YdaD